MSTPSFANDVQTLVGHLAPLTPRSALLVGTTFLAWSHLCATDKLPTKFNLRNLAAHDGDLIATLRELSDISGVVGHGFRPVLSLIRNLDSTQTTMTALAALKLEKNGFLNRPEFGRLLERVEAKDSFSVRVAPAYVVNLMTRLAKVEKAKSIYIPWDATGELTRHTISAKGDLTIGVPGDGAIAPLFALFRGGSTKVLLQDLTPVDAMSMSSENSRNLYESLIAFPPAGVRMPMSRGVGRSGLQALRRSSFTEFAIQHSLEHVNGRAVLAVPNSYLSSVGSDLIQRETLLKDGVVRAVISLPAGALMNTGAQFSLLVLDNSKSTKSVAFIDVQEITAMKQFLSNDNDMLDAIEKVVDSGRSTFGESCAEFVPVKNILADMDVSLQVDRYVISESRKAALKSIKSMANVPIDELLEIIPALPQALRGSQENDAKVLEVGASDIPDVGYLSVPTKELDLDLNARAFSRAEAIFLRKNDLVMITKGRTGRVGFVPDSVPDPGNGGWLISQSMVILRPKKGVDAVAIGMFLRSPVGQELLGSYRKGTTIPMIALRSLRTMQLPDFSDTDSLRLRDLFKAEMSAAQAFEEIEKQLNAAKHDVWSELNLN